MSASATQGGRNYASVIFFSMFARNLSFGDRFASEALGHIVNVIIHVHLEVNGFRGYGVFTPPIL